MGSRVTTEPAGRLKCAAATPDSIMLGVLRASAGLVKLIGICGMGVLTFD
jgi:hypothetical protein